MRMTTPPAGERPRRGHVWIGGLLIAVLLAGHLGILHRVASRIVQPGGLVLGVVVLALAIHLGALRTIGPVLKRVMERRRSAAGRNRQGRL